MISDFFKDCCKINGLVLTTGNRFAIAETEITSSVGPLIENGSMHIAGENWAIHVNLNQITSVQFAKVRERSGLIPYLFNAMAVDAEGSSVVTVFFPNPWLDENLRPVEIQQHRIDLFTAIRDKYIKLDSQLFSYIEG